MKAREVFSLFREAATDWSEDRAPVLGAALAYYTVFSLAPLLVVVIAIAGLVFGADAAQTQIVGQIENLVGTEGAQVIHTMLAAANKGETGIVASALGIAMLLVGAAGLFGQLRDALNTIWEVEPAAAGGVWAFVHDRFLSFTMVLGVAFLLLVSLVVSAALSAVIGLIGDLEAGIVGYLINESISIIVITLLFAMIYRFLPDAKVAWRDVWLGAALTALLFEVGKFLIGLYLGHTAMSSAYGAAGSLAVLLIWLYYSAQIFLFGAELTQAYASKFGTGIVKAEKPQGQQIVNR